VLGKYKFKKVWQNLLLKCYIMHIIYIELKKLNKCTRNEARSKQLISEVLLIH